MTVIKDGTGTGYLARINAENFLEVHAITTTEYVHESIAHGESYRILGTTTIAAGVEKTVLIVINNSDDLLTIERITTSIQGESGKPVIIRIYIGNATVTAGGSSASPVNVNASSVNTVVISGTQNNPTIGGTDSKILEIYMEYTSIDRELSDGAVVLGRNSSIRLTCQGFAGAAGTFNCNTHVLLWKTQKTFHGLPLT